jgi:acetylornithine deacetylase/succinyl-diaminopimelate desuccinylase-like protein
VPFAAAARPDLLRGCAWATRGYGAAGRAQAPGGLADGVDRGAADVRSNPDPLRSTRPRCSAGAEVVRRSASRPVLVDTGHPALRAAARALRRAFGGRPAFVRSGGSIPAVSMLQRGLGVPVVLMGFALPQDTAHGTDESFALSSLRHGIASSIHYMAELGAGRR